MLPQLRNTYKLNVFQTCAELAAGTCTNEAALRLTLLATPAPYTHTCVLILIRRGDVTLIASYKCVDTFQMSRTVTFLCPSKVRWVIMNPVG